MKTVLRTVARKLSSNKLIAAFLLLTTVTAMGLSSVASAARTPRYFEVEKPTSQSVCYGGSWDWEWDWSWHRWHWQREKSWFWTPNYETLGFESRRQCLRYVSTEKPSSKRECRQNWWGLGFESRSHCNRYLRLFPGGGYSGNPQQG
ncbi:MAG: hypothetical protein ABWX94_02290 [Candidatus Saccharimonadales bacterium]